MRHDLRSRALPMRRLGSFLPGIGVGGAGVHWNGQTYRYHPSDFRMRQRETIERYGARRIPEGMSIQDWGITYEELEPYYDRFEYMAGIAGRAGNLRGTIQPGGNPFEGARSREYPVGPMQESYARPAFAKPPPSSATTPSPALRQPAGDLRQPGRRVPQPLPVLRLLSGSAARSAPRRTPTSPSSPKRSRPAGSSSGPARTS